MGEHWGTEGELEKEIPELRMDGKRNAGNKGQKIK